MHRGEFAIRYSDCGCGFTENFLSVFQISNHITGIILYALIFGISVICEDKLLGYRKSDFTDFDIAFADIHQGFIISAVLVYIQVTAAFF